MPSHLTLICQTTYLLDYVPYQSINHSIQIDKTMKTNSTVIRAQEEATNTKIWKTKQRTIIKNSITVTRNPRCTDILIQF